MNKNGESPDINESLADNAREIALAITEFFKDTGYLKRRGFALFIADYDTGTITYASDINHEDAIGMMKAWITREQK